MTGVMQHFDYFVETHIDESKTIINNVCESSATVFIDLFKIHFKRVVQNARNNNQRYRSLQAAQQWLQGEQEVAWKAFCSAENKGKLMRKFNTSFKNHLVYTYMPTCMQHVGLVFESTEQEAIVIGLLKNIKSLCRTKHPNFDEYKRMANEQGQARVWAF